MICRRRRSDVAAVDISLRRGAMPPASATRPEKSRHRTGSNVGDGADRVKPTEIVFFVRAMHRGIARRRYQRQHRKLHHRNTVLRRCSWRSRHRSTVSGYDVTNIIGHASIQISDSEVQVSNARVF